MVFGLDSFVDACPRDSQENQPTGSEDTGEEESALPSKRRRDGSDDKRRDHGAQGAAAIGDRQTAAALRGGKRLGDCAESAGEGRTFAGSEDRAGDTEA